MATPLVVDGRRQNLCRTLAERCDWLLESGIQAPRGYFYAWYDFARDIFVRPYPEITGYGISTLCWLFDLTGDRELLGRARRAFDWLIEDAIHPDWNLVGTQPLSSLDGLDEPMFLYGFDSGIVATALERLARRTPDCRVGQTRDRIAGAFSKHLLLDDGTMRPLIDLRTGTPTSEPRRWSQRFSGYQLKSLMFLMLRHAGDRRPDDESTVRRTVDRVLAGQQDCGAFPGYEDGETHLHAHLYTLEALCTAAAAYGEDQWLERAAAGYRYMQGFIADRGCLPTRAHRRRITVGFERADIVAQFLRLGSYLCGAGCVSRRHLSTDLRWARRQLRRHVIREGPHRGSVLFGRDWDGTVRRHANCAVTLISTQACHWYNSAQSHSRIDPLALV